MKLLRTAQYIFIQWYVRVPELATGLSLIGLAAWLLDDRTPQYNSIRTWGIPIEMFSWAMAVLGLAQIYGIVIDFFTRFREYVNAADGHIHPLVGAYDWRRTCCLLASGCWGAYLGGLLMSGFSVPAIIFSLTFVVMPGAAYLRLGLLKGRNGSTSYSTDILGNTHRSPDRSGNPETDRRNNLPRARAARSTGKGGDGGALITDYVSDGLAHQPESAT